MDKGKEQGEMGAVTESIINEAEGECGLLRGTSRVLLLTTMN